MPVRVRLTGDRALFARPEFTTDLISYDLMTPHAARGVLGALYRDPEIRWTIDAITVLRPILRECLHQCDRRVLMLRNVVYVVDARIEPAADTACDIAHHAARFASAMAAPPIVHLGHIGCKATATLIDGDAPPVAAPGTIRVDHGWLLHGIDPASGRPRYFRAESIGGIVRVPASDSPTLFE